MLTIKRFLKILKHTLEAKDSLSEETKARIWLKINASINSKKMSSKRKRKKIKRRKVREDRKSNKQKK